MRFTIPYAYVVPGKSGPRAKANFARSTMEIDIPEVGRSDLMLAFRCLTNARSSFTEFEVDYRIHEGRLLRPVYDKTGRALSVDDLVRVSASGMGMFELAWWAENPFFWSPVHAVRWGGAMFAWDEDARKAAANAVAREARRAEIAGMMAGAVIADGILYRPTCEPVYGVSLYNGDLHVGVDINADAHRPLVAFGIGSGEFDEFVAAYAARTGERLWCLSRPEAADIVRFDHLRADRDVLLTGGALAHATDHLGEFVPVMSDAARNAYEAIATAAAESRSEPWPGKRRAAHVAAFKGIPAILDGIDRSKPTKAAQARLKRLAPLGAVVSTVVERLGFDLQVETSPT